MKSSTEPTGNNLVRTISNDLSRKNSGSKRRGLRSPKSDSHAMKNAISVVIHDVRKNETLTTLQMRWWDKILDIKVQLRRFTNESLSRHHLYLPKSAKELSNNLTLHDIGFAGNSNSSTTAVEKLRVIIDSSYGKDGLKTSSLIPFNEVIIEDNKIREIIEETKRALSSGQPPGKTDEFDGSGGVYFMKSPSCKYGPVAVFKPLDEEPGMPNNPKGRANETLRDHFSPGQGCFREVAAYIFDVNHFCSVPPTALVYCEHPVFNVNNNKARRTPKVGSLQAHVDSYSDFEGMSSNFFSDFEIQKIALLDLRILNCDRNSANILVRQKQKVGRDHRSYSNLTDSSDDDYQVVSGSPTSEFMSLEEVDNETAAASAIDWELIPIDHGYSMPSRLKVSDMDWVWFDLPAIKRPVCPEIREYVKTLDIDKIIAEALECTQLSEDCIYLLRCAHHFVVSGIENGLTLYEIASLMARIIDDEVPSKFEMAFDMVEENAFRYFNVKTSSHGHFRYRQQPASKPSQPVDSQHDLTDSDALDPEVPLNFSSGMEGAVLRRMSTLNELSLDVDSSDARRTTLVPNRLPSFEEEPSPSGVREALLPSPIQSMNEVSKTFAHSKPNSNVSFVYPRSAEKVMSTRIEEGEKPEDSLKPIPFNLSRVVSFSGFENAKLYSQPKESGERAFANFLNSKEELINSSEFKKYRLDKMIEAMSNAISKVLIAKSAI